MWLPPRTIAISAILAIVGFDLCVSSPTPFFSENESHNQLVSKKYIEKDILKKIFKLYSEEWIDAFLINEAKRIPGEGAIILYQEIKNGERLFHLESPVGNIVLTQLVDPIQDDDVIVIKVEDDKEKFSRDSKRVILKQVDGQRDAFAALSVTLKWNPDHTRFLTTWGTLTFKSEPPQPGTGTLEPEPVEDALELNLDQVLTSAFAGIPLNPFWLNMHSIRQKRAAQEGDGGVDHSFNPTRTSKGEIMKSEAKIVSNSRAGQNEGKSLAQSVSQDNNKNAKATAIDGKLAQSKAIAKGQGESLARSRTSGDDGAYSTALSKGTGTAQGLSVSEGIGKAMATAQASNDADSVAVSNKGGGSEALAKTDQKGSATSNATAFEGGQSKATSHATGVGMADGDATALGGGNAKSLSISEGGGMSRATSKSNTGGNSRSKAVAEKGGKAQSDATSHGGDSVAEAQSLQGTEGAEANAFADMDGKSATFDPSSGMTPELKTAKEESLALGKVDRNPDFTY